MIHWIQQSEKDKKALTLFSPGELQQLDDTFDYRNVLIKKPWGFEYLIFQNKDAAVWALHMKKGAKTSFHCHPNKKTSLTVLAGEVSSKTYSSKHQLKAGEGLIFGKGVFHTTEALNPDWAVIMEVETPTCKTDLFRIDDEYGRQGKRYEGHEFHAVRDDSVCHFHNEKERYRCTKKIGECEVVVVTAGSWPELKEQLNSFEPTVIALLQGRLLGKDRTGIMATGDSMLWQHLAREDGLANDETLELMAIKKTVA
ncbi:MAG: hypothetical protein HYW89_00700 [Candidatus Sungiibacteriota bacterium]|uniref:Cupin 2 conserved barrel domain-containing protein n=1 Tax=Candidatus Sungiibacteriota bacterium TaxID=2750080 RepID=A0A7T5RJR1_9BACT|nr:MAG: hypothetical protein HYW89_00700 [Candidatus Sungbacteria bacterium]